MNNHPLIRKIYLYLFALVGLVLFVIGLVRLVDLGLKSWVFTAADKYYPYPMAAPSSVDKSTSTPSGPSQEELQAYQEQQTAAQRQGDAAEAIAFIVVGFPLYLYHWGMIKKDKEKENA